MRNGFIWMLLASCLASLQADTVTLKNGDHLTGAIQKLENGKLSLKSAYSESALQVDWGLVDTVTSETEFQITLMDGKQAACSPSSVRIADIVAIFQKPAEEAPKPW